MSIYFSLLTFLPIFLLNCSPTSSEGSEGLERWDHEDFRTACTGFHNFLRVVHNAAPLKWDNTLEEQSQAWAQHLNVIQNVHEHIKTTQIGTNIYQTTTPKDVDLLCLYAVDYWYKEEQKYHFDKPGSNWEETGHFTAMVWRATERFGLGEEGQAGGNFYVVAGYDPKPNMKGGYEENVHRLRRIPSSCISKVTKMEYYYLLMDQLKVDRTENKFVYPSNKTCILPTRDNPESQSTSGALTGTAGTSSTMVGTTGTEMGGTGLSQGALRKTPNEILAVPVSGPVGAAHTPEIILGQPEPAPQNAPKVIFVPAIQLQPATERLPVAPGESRVRPETTQLRPQVNSTTTVPLLNTTVYPLSFSVTQTVSTSLSTISKSTIT